MSKIKIDTKDWLFWGIVVLTLFIMAVLGCYFFQTRGDFADKQTDWAEFGSVLGAITGLIAFAGVLFSSMHSLLPFSIDGSTSRTFWIRFPHAMDLLILMIRFASFTNSTKICDI